MNYNIEINKLLVKYGNKPETKDCLNDSLNLFSCFSQDVIQKLKQKALNATSRI